MRTFALNQMPNLFMRERTCEQSFYAVPVTQIRFQQAYVFRPWKFWLTHTR